MGISIFVSCVVISCLVASATAGVELSTLPRTLGVIATINSSAPNSKGKSLSRLQIQEYFEKIIHCRFRNISKRLSLFPWPIQDYLYSKFKNILKKSSDLDLKIF